jgi:diacylglycerol kinase family enzyme
MVKMIKLLKSLKKAKTKRQVRLIIGKAHKLTSKLSENLRYSIDNELYRIAPKGLPY